MQNIFHTFFYLPMFNFLVFLVDILPGGNIGLAVIILTILIKLILFPLSQKSIATQVKMRKIEPEMKKIKEKHKDQKEQAQKIMELYKEHKLNPFSGCFLMLLQLPVIFALYYVFLQGFKFDAVVLYSFVHIPETANTYFLGINLLGKSVVLALIAGASQYYQLRLAMPAVVPTEKGKEPTFQEEFTRNMTLQMKYIFPVMVFFIAYTISSAIALYWIVSNLFAIAQELYVRKTVTDLESK
ncbi:MAG: YidC/Oxa1 family membrane protein insertase [Candidatus Staskawiczbacteria bacterium]|jgi:YidC/Oxa1 family membrane protein insertase